MSHPAIKTFIIYARPDAHYKDELLKHLRPFVKNGLMEQWVDSDLLPGEEWEKRTIKELEAAHLVILLVSADAINSDFIEKKELKIALEKKRAGSARVAPILVRECAWEMHEEIAEMQLLPKDKEGNIRCVASWDSNDSAWTSCVRELKRLVDEIREVIGEAKEPEKYLPEMIYVKGGTFKLGGNFEIKLSDYEIGKYPVTQKLWKVVMGSNPSFFKGDDLPVEQVSWFDCQVFLKKLNSLYPSHSYRLPSEAEWEFSALGGRLSNGYVYSGSDELDEVGWHSHTLGAGKTHPVGQKRPNELGIHDMSGNVWELCSNKYDQITSLPEIGITEDVYSASGRAGRGGSWDDGPADCKVESRCGFSPFDSYNYLGFRLARTI